MNEHAVNVLNDLLQYESQSLLPRVKDSQVFISWTSADERRIIQRMIDEEDEHRAWLVQAVHDLGGDPLPTQPDMRLTTIHFLELHHLLPKVLDDHRLLLSAYESGAARLGPHPHAAQVVARIVARHQRHAEQLSHLTVRAHVTAPPPDVQRAER